MKPREKGAKVANMQLTERPEAPGRRRKPGTGLGASVTAPVWGGPWAPPAWQN